MINKDNKKFMDSVYGYIGVPKCFVENLIDTEYFQRLRNIDQTGMRILYPCAKHDRFSHSIGVFHLGKKAVDSLISNYYEDEKNTENKNILERNKILFLTACLLHDIGHTPFSHSLEDQVLQNSIDSTKKIGISELVTQEISSKEETYNTEKGINKNGYEKLGEAIKKAASHEQMGSLLIIKEFKENIKKVLTALEQFIDDITLDDDLCFIGRMIMGIKYKEIDDNRQIRNCFIELLNGKNFDVDNLDYIIRDTQMSGISNVSLDIERLLGSLCIKTTTKYYDKKIENKTFDKKITILKIANNQKQEISINANLMGTITIKKGSKVIIKQNSFFEKLIGKQSETALIHFEEDKIGTFTGSTIVKTYGYTIGELESYRNGLKYLRGKENNMSFGCKIENANTKEEFEFYTDEDIELVFKDECHITIIGSFESESTITLFNTNLINGDIEKLELLGDAFSETFTNVKNETINGYKSYCICFKKQAINVIANVLKARNFLYLWIYAHHKVVYYANFLIPIIAKELTRIINKDSCDFPEWELNFENIKYLDDSYIWTLMRHIIYANSITDKKKYEISTEINDLLIEILNRKYRKSLYKSLVECELFFENFNQDEMLKLVEKLGELTDEKKPYIENVHEGQKNKYDVGYFNNDVIEEINKKLESKKGDTFKLEELIYVFANYKLKKLDAQKVYIELGTELVPAERMALLETLEVKQIEGQKKYYFYIYYKPSCESVDISIIEELKKKIKDYFKKIIR